MQTRDLQIIRLLDSMWTDACGCSRKLCLKTGSQPLGAVCQPLGRLFSLSRFASVPSQWDSASAFGAGIPQPGGGGFLCAFTSDISTHTTAIRRMGEEMAVKSLDILVVKMRRGQHLSRGSVWGWSKCPEQNRKQPFLGYSWDQTDEILIQDSFWEDRLSYVLEELNKYNKGDRGLEPPNKCRLFQHPKEHTRVQLPICANRRQTTLVPQVMWRPASVPASVLLKGSERRGDEGGTADTLRLPR